MKNYLKSLLIEQKNRALALKNLIPFPLKYSELSGLAERCTTILNSQNQMLEELLNELKFREESDLRDIFRQMRVCARSIAWTEYYGIPPLHYQTSEIGFLNKLMFRINRETKSPLPHPAVCCITTEHYYLNLFTNVIFAPITESEFLLHLPDFYHELGHHIVQNRKTDMRLNSLAQSYDNIFSIITNHYQDLLKSKRRSFIPEDIPMLIERIHAQWKMWIEEFFCDLFALYLVGPAYAWSHLHFIAKHSDNIHRLNIINKQSHPSDESRMRLLLIGLNKIGFESEAKAIEKRWYKLKEFWSDPANYYQYAYPDKLLEGIGDQSLLGMKNQDFQL